MPRGQGHTLQNNDMMPRELDVPFTPLRVRNLTLCNSFVTAATG